MIFAKCKQAESVRAQESNISKLNEMCTGKWAVRCIHSTTRILDCVDAGEWKRMPSQNSKIHLKNACGSLSDDMLTDSAQVHECVRPSKLGHSSYGWLTNAILLLGNWMEGLHLGSLGKTSSAINLMWVYVRFREIRWNSYTSTLTIAMRQFKFLINNEIKTTAATFTKNNPDILWL